MQLTITNQELEAIFNDAAAFQMEASDALQATYQTTPSVGFLPDLNHIPHEQVQRMAIEVKEYTERCWHMTNRLRDIQPAPANIYIVEFGL